MNLAGNLKDLGLGEILQIVGLSRNTGVLSLNTSGKTGAIFFCHGQVVRASDSTYQQGLGEVLIHRGLISLDVLRKALLLQQEQGFCERLGVVLAKNFGVPMDVVEEIVREQIENAVLSMFDWAEGKFEFEVQSIIEIAGGARIDYMVDQGLNPQFLAIEGNRLMTEKSKRADAGVDDHSYGDAASSAVDPAERAGTRISPTNPVIQTVVIVDDDSPTLRVLSDMLTESGFVIHPLTQSDEALVKVEALSRAGECPVVLIDLIMPKMDGSGVLGGIELMELLHNNFKDLHLVAMADYHDEDAEKKVHGMGYPFILKPRRVEIYSPTIREIFLSELLNYIRDPLEAESVVKSQNRFSLGDELRIEMGDPCDDRPTVEEPPGSRRLSLLGGMLEELNNPDLEGGVLLLLLRFASEFLNRAIVFTISDNIVSGFGQFGISGGKINGDERVRSIHFPLESGSMFKELFRTGRPVILKPGSNALDTRIFEQLGGGVPEEIFIGPIESQSEVIGFLYGDNLPDNELIGDIEALVIFLAQAGIAWEQSIFGRQMHERPLK